MFFLNLTAGEFLTLLGALGGLITALYLLDRTKRKKVVSTLRFWMPGLTAQEQRRRKRMREPWSLMLQLASLLLLLLAVAQLQWGPRARRARDQVLLLDTSSWTAEATGEGSLLDREKAVARQYLAALPSRDRVLLLRADALATPVTSFTSDRTQLVNAVNASEAGFSALNIDQALSFARQAQSWSGGQPGEIVYIGPRLIPERDLTQPGLSNLRAITVEASRANCGIRNIGVKRGDEDPNSWQATVTLKNYSLERRRVRLQTQFAGTMFAPRVLTLAAGQEVAAEYNFVTDTAGRLVARIAPADDLSSDNQATLELPKLGMLKVAVYTDRPDVLRPLLEANHRLSVKFLPPSEYQAKPAADVMVLDRIGVPQQPKIASLWIEPPTDRLPLALKTVVSDAVVKNWNSETALGAGLHAKEVRVPSAEVFQTFEGDVPVASVPEGPIVVARGSNENHAAIAVIGFDPLDGQLRFEVTTPLLFANLLRWLSPQSFRELDITAGQVGAATVTLDPRESLGHIRVRDESGFAVPFTVRNQTLQLFASRPSIVHIVSDDRERVLSLTLPEVAEFEWKPPVNTAAGMPAASRFVPAAVDLWKWLAVLGGSGLFIEWMLFGRRRGLKWPKSSSPAKSREAQQRETELVSR